MDRVLGCYIGWHPALPLSRSTDEKNFDKACRRWEGESGSQQSSPIERNGPSTAIAQSHSLSSSASELATADEGGEQPATVRFSRTFRIFCAWKPAT